MKKQDIVIIAGTRPECIKMAPVYFALRDSPTLRPVFLSTAQHRQMLDQALAVFGITPDHDLNLMQPGQTLPDLTGRVLAAVAAYLREHRPAAILVQGDTTTVLASALAAFYERIPVGHVEAGLRTGDIHSPFPEEMNRRLTAPLARWHFCPTEQSRQNLLHEGIPAAACTVTGNTVIDALLHVRARLNAKKISPHEIANRCKIPPAFAQTYFADNNTAAANTAAPANKATATTAADAATDDDATATTAAATNPRYILVTGHRRESFGDGFENICCAILQIVERHPGTGVLYPVHLNPRVQEPVNRLLAGHPAVALIPPVDYEDFIALMDRAHFVLSDSGGVQEEAPGLGKPVLVMRDTTERPEGVTAGTCRLVGTDPAKILHESSILLSDPTEYARRSTLKNPYGDGLSAQKIRTLLETTL
jgi:UDP-N-acetylglucosamine 2-epimerase (non-hydrolysing)